MDQRITGFHKDDEDHWVAELECGHNQHVRHNPPWTLRPWTQSGEGRRATLGQTLACRKCDTAAPRDRPVQDPRSGTNVAATAPRAASTKEP